MDDLTAEQLDELAQRLRDLESELTQQKSASRDGTRPVDLDEPIGRLSRMDAMQQQQMSQAHARRLDIRLQQVRAALNKLDRGEYGECNLCGELIGYPRLSVKPESPLCLPCQSERE